MQGNVLRARGQKSTLGKIRTRVIDLVWTIFTYHTTPHGRGRLSLYSTRYFSPLLLHIIRFARNTLALPPSSNSDPESHSGPSSPLSTSVRAVVFLFIARRTQHFLPSSTRSRRNVPTHAAGRSEQSNLWYHVYKNEIHSSCEIEDFAETHLCKLCVILRSRMLLGVCPHQGYRSATPLTTTECSLYQR